MTLKEAKKILESEGFKLGGPGKSGVVSEFFTEYESPKICEAMQIVCSAGFQLAMLAGVFDERKERLKKEYEQNTKAPGSAENRIKEDSDVNPALEEAASQFNDALLDEQAKKIAELTKENERLKDQVAVLDACKKHNDKIDRKQIKCLGKEIARLNKIIHKKNLKIEELRKESSRHLEGKMKMFGETVDLEQELKDKNAILSDVAEELRLSKIRENNLVEVSQKYVKEVEDLREKLANNVVDKIDAQALKSAESALAYKEKVIDKLTKENNDYKKCVEEFRNKIADMTIGKIDIQNIRLKEKNKEIKELNDKLKSINKNRHNELAEKDEVIADLGKELAEAKKQNTAVMVDMTAKCLGAARESVNDVFESYAAKYAKSTLDELKEEAYNSFNAKAHNLGLVGSKDGNGIFDQMVGVDIAEEGADHSGVIVLCGKDFIDAIKKMK